MKKKGFTLAELLVVIVILGILLALAIPSIYRYLIRGTEEYYHSLEKTVMLSGEDYLNDYRALLPRGMNNVTVVELKELTDNKYIENVVDSKGNPCDARVTAKKIGNNDYEYYSCLICSDYQTEGEACLFDENNNVTDDSDDYEIEVDDDGDYELEAEGVYIVYQGDDFDVPYGTAYYKGEVVSDKVVGNPRIIDTNKLGTTIVKYVYHGKTAEITVKVIDRVKPSVSQVVLRHDDKNGSIYKGEWYSGDIYEEYLSTDYSKPGIEGSGVDYYELSRDGKTYERLSSNYHVSTENGEQSYYVRSVDKSGNIGDANTYRVKIDKEVPSCSLKVTSGTLGNNNWYTSDVGIDFESIEEEVSSVVSQIISKKTITEETTGMTVTGMVTDEAGNIGSCSIQVKVDKTAPRITSNLTDGNYTNTQNVTYTASDSYSGIEAIQYEVYLNGNLHSSNHLQSQTATFNLNSAGTWEIYIKALDRAGHWDNGGNWSHYTYGINLCPYAPGQTWEFNYTGGAQSFTVPCSGTYKLEVYGAQGGNSSSYTGGMGGYTQATYKLENNDGLTIHIGQAGNGVNAGSSTSNYRGGNSDNTGAGGGAASLIQITRNNLTNPLLISGGGGGASTFYMGGNGGNSSGTLSSSGNGEQGSGGGGGGYQGGLGGQAISDIQDYIWIPNMNVQDKEYNIDRTKVNGSYTNVYGASGSYGYTEKVDGVYSYIQIMNTGAINELFTGYVDTSEGQGLRFQALMDTEEPADYDTNQSYIEYIDQNGNTLYRLTFQQIKDQIDYGVHNRSYYIKDFYNGNYYGQYHFDVSFTIPAGVSKVGFKIHCVTVNPSRDPSNSAIYVERFGLSNLGRSSSGGTNYINNGYNCLNPLSQAGIWSGNGFARITLISTN